jgi:AraC-like DNA-binding protein/quercetin dioxygenase-like cupin family protein
MMSRFDWRSQPINYGHIFNRAKLLAEQNPFVIGVYEARAADPHPLHWHEAFEIGYCLEGAGITVVEGREYPFGPGHVHVINDTYRHMDYAEAYARMFNVHFLPEILDTPGFHELESVARRPFMAGVQRFAPVLPIDSPHTSQVVELLKAISVEQSTTTPGWMVVIKGLVVQIVGLLIRHFLIPEPEAPETRRRRELLARLAPALQLLDEHLENPPSLKDLAAKATLSPPHFCALFREAMGSSPVAYRNTRRIDAARHILAETDLPIIEIAHQCGFSTVVQFNRVFRQLVNCTPSAYRRQTSLDRSSKS